jgi:putative sigma-54 modulation protein
MAINVEVFGKNMDIHTRLNEHILSRVSRLDKYLSDIEDVRVDLEYAKTARSAAQRQVAEITARGKKFILRSEERSDDILTAFDMALDKIQRQIERYKGKHQKGRGDGTSLSDMVAGAPGDADEGAAVVEEEPVIARRKKFHLAPMDEYEAIEQMKLLGHENFFVYFNIETNAVNVVYRRQDGTYGVIETELA